MSQKKTDRYFKLLQHISKTRSSIPILTGTFSCYKTQRKSNKMQQCIKILFHIYMKLNMFRASRRPSSGAYKLHQQPLVLHTWRVVGRVVAGRCEFFVNYTMMHGSTNIKFLVLCRPIQIIHVHEQNFNTFAFFVISVLIKSVKDDKKNCRSQQP